MDIPTGVAVDIGAVEDIGADVVAGEDVDSTDAAVIAVTADEAAITEDLADAHEAARPINAVATADSAGAPGADLVELAASTAAAVDFTAAVEDPTVEGSTAVEAMEAGIAN